MTPDELVERVAYGWTPLEVRVHEAIYRDGRGHDVPRYLIRAAIAVALEEAAKACEAIEDQLDTQWRGGLKVCSYTEGASDGANDCAAAIRALKEQRHE